MTTKYAVLNPNDGSYTYFETEQEALDEFYLRLVQHALPHFHNITHSIVTIDENGAETWTTPDGNILETPQDNYQDLSVAMERARAMLDKTLS